MYAIILARTALKDLNDIPEPFYSSIERRIASLSAQPFPHGVTKLSGYKAMWRVRVGNYRIIYAVDERSKTVDICGIGHRQSIYKN